MVEHTITYAMWQRVYRVGYTDGCTL